ncbi:outer membrane protein [Pandoraea anhela]|uniref:Porin n=1 Tax=Pandoraea anhela TaxID=2508295 RepID=A0A5E4WY50_9BURK|nr:outer membrane beta-barrel protein [Pandoraea anhela]VVE27896.1 porin [Pandoraea anhela]
MRKQKLVIASWVALGFPGAAFADGMPQQAAESTGYYGAARLIGAFDKINSMELTSPRVSGMIAGPKAKARMTGSLALGYQFGGGWRAEGEYVFKRSGEFDSYWAPFNANANRFKVSSQRLMLNGYRDFDLGHGFSVYGTLGLGVAIISADGWQGNPSRRFASRTQTNLTYSAGAGVSYAIDKRFTLDVGYRYVDMGNVETSFNTFQNRIGARDEQLKGRLASNEVFVGVRGRF